MFKNYSSLCDVVSLLAYCPDDPSCLLLKDLSGEYVIPHRKVEKNCWKVCVFRMVSELFGPQSQQVVIEPLQVNKVWLMNHKSTHIYHTIYTVSVKSSNKRIVSKHASSQNRYVWMGPLDLENLINKNGFKSPETTHLLQQLFGEYALPHNFDLMLNEEEHVSVLNEYCEENTLVDCALAPSGSGTTVSSTCESGSSQRQLIQAAGYTKEDQLRMYREFLLMVFPEMYMSPHLFTQFLLDLGWQRQQCPALFRAADVHMRGGLSFREFLMWTAALEPCTEHRGIPAELRCRYIFRYFDTNRDLKMDYSEFKDFIAATRSARQLPTDSLSVTKEADECLRHLELQSNSTISLNDFLRGVNEMQIRGTSSLLRAPKSIIGYFADLQAERDKDPKVAAKMKKPALGAGVNAVGLSTNSQASPPASPVPLPTSETGGGRRRLVQRADYSVAAVTVRLSLQKDVPNEMLQLKEFNFETVSPSTLKLIMPTGVAPSLELLGPDSVPVETLAAIHYFARESLESRRNSTGGGGTVRTKPGWSWASSAEEARLGALLCQLADTTKPIFEQESRVLKLSSPIYAVGDLHGNLPALLSIEKTLWPYGVALSPASMLFLGDYVDRGIHGAELMAYLLAVKLQRPNGVFLIRGNHETRDIQKMFTFYKECIEKYGDNEGNKIWNAINNVFDVLPLAAVVDDKVFCCHGGIPPPWVCPLVSGIERVPVPLPHPAEQSTIAWELIWNDPVIPTKITGSLSMELAKNEGFASNARRGTGHVFDQLALDRFLLANHLSHVVRAHEMHQNGFMMQMRGRLVSVFSSSHYCGGTNDSGVAFLDGEKVRVIRINHQDTYR